MADDNNDGEGDVPAFVLDIAAIALAVVLPAPGAALSSALVVKKLLDDKRGRISAETFTCGISDSFRESNGRIDGLEEKLRGLDAEEAWVKGARAALMTPRLEKARRMGQVLGSTLATDHPRWKEAAEFIADLEQFGDDDIEAIRILWKEQRREYRSKVGTEVYMEADDAAYVASWPGVIAGSKRAGIAPDDWTARCARLGGFGLVISAQPKSPTQGKGPFFRLTTRAVRLLQLLDLFVGPGVYPAVRYHATLGSKTVKDEDEDAQLGEGWQDRPFPPPT